MNYPQQPYGGQNPPGHGGGYGPPPPPPKKNTTAVVSLVVAIVAVLVTLGITGFVAPGFFLGDEDGTPLGGGSTVPKTPSSTGGEAERVLTAVAEALDSQDRSALEDLTCADAEPAVPDAIKDVDDVTGAELTDTDEVIDNRLKGTLAVTVGDRSGDFEVTVVRSEGDWCWQDITLVGTDLTTAETAEPSAGPEGDAPTAGGKPVPEPALTAMRGFLDAINAGDAAAAKGALCADAISTPADVDELIGYDPDLSIDPAMDGIASGTESVQLYLKGTAKGQELEGYSTNLWVTGYDGTWCVHGFRAVVI